MKPNLPCQTEGCPFCSGGCFCTKDFVALRGGMCSFLLMPNGTPKPPERVYEDYTRYQEEMALFKKLNDADEQAQMTPEGEIPHKEKIEPSAQTIEKEEIPENCENAGLKAENEEK